MPLVAAIDIGTASARAGVFDAQGKLLGRAEAPIEIRAPAPDHAEHDSANIWQAAGRALLAARAEAAAGPEQITGLAFDATCSLVLRDAAGRPVTASTTGEDRWDTIVWLDHRATAEAEEASATPHTVLDHSGGALSPEMQIPKLMWLKRHLPDSWARTAWAFDLTDYLTWEATGNPARSACALTCKWSWLAHETPGWRGDFLDRVGLGDLLARTGQPKDATPTATDLGPLTPRAARDLGLAPGTRVATGLIDAHAGALGVLGHLSGPEVERHLALIAGTSSCVMAFTEVPRMTPGVWGPYLGGSLSGLWMNEGGQSASGALLDHVIRLHGHEATREMHARIIARVIELRAADPDLAPRLHILPDFHGNRSPLADPHATGVVSGLTLDSSLDALARVYYRTAVAIALGTRHILEALNARGWRIDTLHVAGGHTKNPLLMELYADTTGCKVVAPAEDAVLLGSAMTGAVAAGLQPSLAAAAAAMARTASVHEPNPDRRAGFDRDHAVFLRMHEHRREIERLSAASG